MTLSFKPVGALVLSAAALSAGMLTAASAEPRTQHYVNKAYEPPYGVDCDKLVSNYDPYVKHSRDESQQLAECEKSKHEKKSKHDKDKHEKGKGERR
ncbi:MAG: hypothetical protein ACRDP6_08970 [Actinoallomurus sp.]